MVHICNLYHSYPMKKLFFVINTLIAVSVLLVSFSSCSKEGDGDGELIEQLIGTWDINSVTVEIMGQTMSISADEAIQMAKDAAGGNNTYIIDQTLNISEGSINGYEFVLRGKKVVKYLGMDTSEIDGLTLTVENVTSNSFILRYKFDGTLKEDLKYVRRN